jgi:ferrochelatase
MTRYLGNRDFEHGTPCRTGVLLVNLGTPADPSVAAVRRYLAEFLADPRVIEAPRALWWFVLHGYILRTRPRRSAHAYGRIWTPAGSPLMVESRRLATRVAASLQTRFGDSIIVDLAMTYGAPSIPTVLKSFEARNVRRLLVLPLYPQYSATTTGSVFDIVTRELGSWRWLPDLRLVSQYWQHDRYLAAVTASISRHWQEHGRSHLLFSFHSIPLRYFRAGDPYYCFCQATARAVAAQLDLAPSDWSVGFQSRFGREEWLKPYLDHMLAEYATRGPRRVTVVCPGFATDCLETLEEIAMRERAAFLAQGGETFDYVPCLNASDAHVAALEAIVLEHLRGWPGLPAAPDERAALSASREHALTAGALR